MSHTKRFPSEWEIPGLPLETAAHIGFKASNDKKKKQQQKKIIQTLPACFFPRVLSPPPPHTHFVVFLHLSFSRTLYRVWRSEVTWPFYTISCLFFSLPRFCNVVSKRDLCHFPRSMLHHISSLKTGCLTSYKASCVMSCQIRGDRKPVSLSQHKQTHYSARTLSGFSIGAFILWTSLLNTCFLYRWEVLMQDWFRSTK